MDDHKPFRWDLSRREQLPKVPPAALPEHWPGFELELRRCAARVIAAAGDTDWVFVGRSPEHLFDYLSGIFAGSSDTPSLAQLIVSMRGIHLAHPPEAVAREDPEAFAALRSYFAAERLDPAAVACRVKPVTFIDVVSSGTTFGNLVAFLRVWARHDQVDWNAVQRRLRFIGLTKRRATSPKTWRSQQHQLWLGQAPDAAVRNVSVAPWVLEWMAHDLAKLTPSHTLGRWAQLRGGPGRNAEQLAGLRIACRLYDLGRIREERLALAAAIAALPDMRDPWVRGVVLRLRRRSRTPGRETGGAG
jgi:hypothetical protein